MDAEISLLLISEARTREKPILGSGPSRSIPPQKPLVSIWPSPICILVEASARVSMPLQQNCPSWESTHFSSRGASLSISFQKHWPFVLLLLELLIHGCPYNTVTSQILQGSDMECVWAA